MKIFYSAEDIENFADQGQREIRVDENVVLTDLARQTAHMLGIRITEDSSGTSPGTAAPARPQPVSQHPGLSGKPKGCQRRPGNKPTLASGTSYGKSQPVVDKLVEKVKRISNQ
jgi:hypothetical protein